MNIENIKTQNAKRCFDSILSVLKKKMPIISEILDTLKMLN